jgi:hypothetical protein
MTAHQAGMRNGLTAIGFSVAAAAEIVNEQGYDPLTTLAELTNITIGDLISTAISSQPYANLGEVFPTLASLLAHQSFQTQESTLAIMLSQI